MSIEGIIRQDETWIAIDGVVGCKMDCKYCFLQIYNQTPNAGKVLTPPNELIEKLLTFKNYTKDSYLMIGSETDIFMHSKNVEYLIQLISLLQYKSIQNKIVLVTKNSVPKKFIEFVNNNSLKDKIVFYFSYSGLPKEIEPAVNQDKLKDSIAEISENNLKVIHYWRPLLPQNTTADKIQEIADFINKYAMCSVVLGLKYNPKIIENMSKFWDDLKYTNYISNVGQIYPYNKKDLIYKYFQDNFPNYPLFETNSCALSYVNNKPDFNGFFNSEYCLNNKCPESQREICKISFREPTRDAILEAFNKANVFSTYKIIDNQLFVDSELEHGQLIFLRQLLNFPVSPKSLLTKNEWSGAVTKSVDINLHEYKINDLIELSLKIKSIFKSIEKQPWTKKEFSKELLVQLGHLTDILLKQTHKYNNLSLSENKIKIGDEISDVLLNTISILEEGGNLRSFLGDKDQKTINSLILEKHKNLDLESCYNLLTNTCFNIFSKVNLEKNNSIFQDLLECLSLCILLSYYTQSDIEKSYLEMYQDSRKFVLNKLNSTPND
jgi:DNA repair photolyase